MNILTFDVEEWFHLLDNSSTKSEKQWNNYEVRIHDNIDRIFRVLEDTNTPATFFIIGWIAKKYPEVVKRIAEKYEVASHTDSHQLVWQQSKEGFRQDADASIKRLQDITGKPVKYFRAPGFSIRPSEAWAFEILHDLGVEIDCSIFPAHHAHGGFPEYGQAAPAIIEINGKRIKEMPISCANILGKHIIYQGGGYFRLFPYFLIKYLTKKDYNYLLSYIHPRDLDADQPMVPGLPLIRKFKSYVGLNDAERKLRQYLTDFKFTDIDTANKSIDWKSARVLNLSDNNSSMTI